MQMINKDEILAPMWSNWLLGELSLLKVASSLSLDCCLDIDDFDMCERVIACESHSY